MWQSYPILLHVLYLSFAIVSHPCNLFCWYFLMFPIRYLGFQLLFSRLSNIFNKKKSKIDLLNFFEYIYICMYVCMYIKVTCAIYKNF